MAIYTNVLEEFRLEIETQLSLNDVIDILIAEKLIDEKLYIEIWGHQKNRMGCLLDIILQDAKRCSRFINILGNISHMKNLFDSINNSIEKIYKMIVIGGFPEFSLNYVVRNSVANTIKEKALDLDPKFCSTLVVHGLPGFGKSCLVNQVLQTKRFFDVSEGAMFWINLGEHSDTTTVINPLWNLYLTAVKLTNQVALPHRPEDIFVLQNEIRRIFLNERLAHSYIILDDVKSSDVLNIFRLRCKIIVTTQDKNIANDCKAFFVKVTTGFTKKESLELLRKSLDTENLSSKESFVNKIHELCDGCPMLLNIIGSILKDSREEALSTDIIWDSIINEILKKDYLSHPTTKKVILMICRFVSCLNPEIQTCFHSLAVFPKHVNIRPEILMKLWNKNYYSVRRIMVELENKSLIVSFYNKDLETYIYSIHSLVRIYLVEKVNVDVKYYHQKMISMCEDLIAKPQFNDPISNYIFGYYGYHAKHAEFYEKFDKFFDLMFIENKIRLVGSADLLTDFEVYKDLITKKELVLQRKLNAYINFVNAYSAHLHISPETNIIQFAFFNDTSCVYEAARKFAIENPDELYFKLYPYSGVQKKFPLLKATSIAKCTCFINPEEVLVGTDSGTIEVKSFYQYQHKVQRFEGHVDEVCSLQLSPDGKGFLSISLDHTAKLWRFAEELDPQSPKLKQTNWKNLHSPDENIQPHKTFKMGDSDYITSAAFPPDNSDEIVTASKKGKITRWNIKTATVIRETALGLPISHVCYTHNSQQIIFSYDGKVYIYLRANLLYNGQFGMLEDIKDLVLIPVYSDTTEVAVLSSRKCEIWDYIKKTKTFKFDTNADIRSAAVSTDFLVLGTEQYIHFYNYKLQNIIQYKNESGVPASLFVAPKRVVFIALENENVQRCELYLAPNEKPLVQDLTLFSCYWKDSLPIYFFVDENNKIDIFNGSSMILGGIDIHDQITCGTFSLCGNYLILGTITGKICFYNYKTRKSEIISVCNEEIKIMKCCETNYNVLYGDNTHKRGTVIMASKKRIVILMENNSVIQQEIPTPLSDIFCVDHHLITIDIDRSLSVVKIFDNQFFDWMIGMYKEVVFGAIHNGKQLLAIVSKNTNIFVLKIFHMTSPGSMTNIFEATVNSQPKCLGFSFNGKLLAVGCVNGDIKIINLENKAEDVMILHKRSVENVMFAPNAQTILVSLGDQIAWWNLENFLEKDVPKLPNLDVVSHQVSMFTFDLWKNKKLNPNVPYLLTSTNIHGKQLLYMSASKDFRSFLVVDVDGNIFKLEIIN